MKLRLLNGSHSTDRLSRPARRLAHRRRRDRCSPNLRAHISALMTEVATTLHAAGHGRSRRLPRRAADPLRQSGACTIAPRRSPWMARRNCRSACSPRRWRSPRRGPAPRHASPWCRRLAALPARPRRRRRRLDAERSRTPRACARPPSPRPPRRPCATPCSPCPTSCHRPWPPTTFPPRCAGGADQLATRGANVTLQHWNATLTNT